jgi:hypothetical protein
MVLEAAGPAGGGVRRAGEPAGEDGGEWQERIRGASRMSEALSTLDAAQREVIVLFEIDGYTIAEVAEMQRASVPAVKSGCPAGAGSSVATTNGVAGAVFRPGGPVALADTVRNHATRARRPAAAPLLATAAGPDA